MGKPIPSEVGAVFETMVTEMAQKAGLEAAPKAHSSQPYMAALLAKNGVNLAALKDIGYKPENNKQVAALNNDDMQRGTSGQGIV